MKWRLGEVECLVQRIARKWQNCRELLLHCPSWYLPGVLTDLVTHVLQESWKDHVHILPFLGFLPESSYSAALKTTGHVLTVTHTDGTLLSLAN